MQIEKVQTYEMVSKCVETCRYDPSATGLIHYAEMYGKLAFMIWLIASDFFTLYKLWILRLSADIQDIQKKKKSTGREGKWKYDLSELLTALWKVKEDMEK